MLINQVLYFVNEGDFKNAELNTKSLLKSIQYHLDLKNKTAACYDCRRPYGHDNGFPDLLVQKSVWQKISPTGHEGGLLCPCCLIKRLVDVGLKDVPATFVSGPLKMITEEEMNKIFTN